MRLVDGNLMNQLSDLKRPEIVYNRCMAIIVKFAQHGAAVSCC